MAGYNRPDHVGGRRPIAAGRTRRDARRPVRRGRNSSRTSMAVLAGSVLLIIIVIVIALIARGGGSDAAVYDPATDGSVLVNVLSEGLATATPEPTPEPTPSPTPEPVSYGSLPAPYGQGFLPVVSSLDTDEKIIAITVDDCFQFENTRTIIDLIHSTGGNFTLFPIGKNILKEGFHDELRYAYESGVQIENHTYEHSAIYNKDDEGLARQIYMNKACLDYVLGVDYQHHFFRPMGGNGLYDQRMHMYCESLGYRAIAYWSVSGSDSSIEDIRASLAPGQIYLFHTTDSDLEKLQDFVPYAVSQGYRIVTLNEMFGLPDNEVKPLDGPVADRETPQPGNSTMYPFAYTANYYSWGALLIQEKLIEEGYLTGEADGIYGDGTVKAVKEFQQDNGLDPTGECDPETQKMLFADDPDTLFILQGSQGVPANAAPATTISPAQSPAPEE